MYVCMYVCRLNTRTHTQEHHDQTTEAHAVIHKAILCLAQLNETLGADAAVGSSAGHDRETC